MKATLYLLTAVVLCLFTVSCQKEVGFPPDAPGASDNKVKTYTEDVSDPSSGDRVVATYNLNYDSKGRLTGLVMDTAPSTRFEYSYPGDKLVGLDIYDTGALSIHEQFYLNSSSLLDSTLQYNEDHDTTTEKYIYNAAKQLIAINEFECYNGVYSLSDITQYSYDNSGNLIKEEDLYELHTYTYESVIKNTAFVSPPLLPVFNLPAEETATSGGETFKSKHTYTFDSSKRLTTDRADITGGIVIIKTYTYF